MFFQVSAKQTPEVKKKSRPISEKSSLSQTPSPSPSTIVSKPLQKHKTIHCEEPTDKPQEKLPVECSVVTNNMCKNTGLLEALPSFGIKSKSNDFWGDRKAQYASINTNIPAPCSFYKDTKNTLAALAGTAGNSDTLTSKHRSLCDDIHSPQIDLSPSLLSPTAAFLLSFPVVSSTLTKPVEAVNNYVEGVQKMKQR